MKKKKFLIFSIFCIFCILIGMAVSCSDKINIPEQSQPDVDEKLVELITYHINDDYKVSENEMLEDLENFLFYKDRPLNEVSSTQKTVKNYTFNKVLTQEVSLSSKNQYQVGVKNSTDVEDDTINFSIINVEGFDEDMGYAVMSDDKRLGTLLMYTDDSDFVEDISGDTFLQFISASFGQYMENMKETWDDIDETDYEALKKHYGITDEQIEEARKKNENRGATKAMFGTSYSKWSSPIKKGPLLKTKWDQYKYSGVINESKGTSGIPVGCGPLAAAQIMAYYRYPKRTQLYNLAVSILNNSYPSAKGWTGEYNWEEILNDTPDGVRDASCLLYEIGRRAWTSYNYGGSGALTPLLMNVMFEMGYETPNTTLTSNYSFNAIRESIDKDAPVFVEGYTSGRYIGLPFWKWIEWGAGSGHAFVCDGYLYQERNKTTYVFWIPIKTVEKNEYIHLNVGWGGDSNGWYKSGVFDMKNGYTKSEDGLAKKGTTSNDYDFSKVVRIWPNIRPKN